MAHEIVIPRLGWSMEEGTFVGWLKKDGDFVRRGEALFELEGEKAQQEIESVDEGILRIPPSAPKPGSVITVGTVVGYLITANESIPDAKVANQPVTSTRIEAIDALSPNVTPVVHQQENSTIASPRARRVASELGLDWKQLTGTGMGGRIRERDVRTASKNSSSATRIPLTSRRRAIAQRMVASRQQTVPVSLTMKADATNLVNLREQFKSQLGSAPIPSYQDIITKLVAESLKQHPLLAGQWDEDAIVVPRDNELHLGMAVDTDDGLLVPVLRNVGQRTLTELAMESRRLIEQARAGRLAVTDMQGSVFTISNLGAFGVDAFTPVINLPEAAILGLGAIRREPIVLEDGRIVAKQQITLSLTFDHRIVDGAPAARFLQNVAIAIADPNAWLRTCS